jgi:large repetitive protein
VEVVDSDAPAQSASRVLTVGVVVLPLGLAITTGSLPDARAGVPYQHQIQYRNGGGQPSWSLQAGALPPDVTLDPSTGVLSGTPQQPGEHQVTVRVDIGLENDSRTLTLKVW